MNIQKIFAALLSAIVLLTATSIILPQAAYAQCGMPGTPPCPPSGGKNKRPTKTPFPSRAAMTTATSTIEPSATSTAELTATPTERATPCYNPNGDTSAKCYTPPPCVSISGDARTECTATPAAGIAPAVPGNPPSGLFAGLGSPGPLGMIIAVLIIVVCFGLFVWLRNAWGRRGMADGSANPGPTQDLTNGFGKEFPFEKESPFDKDFRFGKVFPYEKELPGGVNAGSIQEAASRFAKMTSNHAGSPVADDLNPQPLPPKGISGNLGELGGEGGSSEIGGSGGAGEIGGSGGMGSG